ARTGDRDRCGGSGGLDPAGQRRVRDCRGPLRDRRGVGRAHARDVAVAAAPLALEEGRQRQERGDLRPNRRVDEDAGIEAGEPRLAATRLAVRDMAGHAALVARAERARRGVADDRLDAAAALAADQLGVLLGEPAACAEGRGFDRRAAHAEALAVLAVAAALESTQSGDLVVLL